MSEVVIPMTGVVIHTTKAGMWVSEVLILVAEVVIDATKAGMWLSEVVICDSGDRGCDTHD